MLTGDDKAVAQLLSQNPGLIAGEPGRSAMLKAVTNGDDQVVEQLLVANPELAFAIDIHSRTTLHLACQGGEEGHERIAARLLAAAPNLIRGVNLGNWTALHYACRFGREATAEKLLAAKPELAFATTHSGDTALHYAAGRRFSNALKRLLELNPEAVRVLSKFRHTPFDEALMINNFHAIDFMQSYLTFGEIMDAFVAKCKSVERYRPVVESQCESLVVVLNQDVVGIVFEYLGFARCVNENLQENFVGRG